MPTPKEIYRENQARLKGQHDTRDFLDALLGYYDRRPDEPCPEMKNMTIYKFSPEFTEHALRFVNGFTAYLDHVGFDRIRIRNLTCGSLGGNLFLELCGSGCSFLDDADPELGTELERHAGDYAGVHFRNDGSPSACDRFEMLDLYQEDGILDLSIMPERIDFHRRLLFVMGVWDPETETHAPYVPDPV